MSDCKKWVETPAISGYLFVYIDSSERLEVLQTNFVIKIIRFQGKDAVIPAWQIDSMKAMINQKECNVEVSSIKYERGQKIQVNQGPLKGLKGHLTFIKNRQKVIVNLDQINISFSIELPSNYIEAI